ncbi:F0F1 ATP synthase subunit epsilon [Euzebya rosea]|uniref:F0F1 ATP synthase subunit epsilon n=1 Tax=Euzebya rosea TaxID=2052804 RepID=UPI000D3E9C27|nr:F0F1 ATP synthase subunit epsilon [Euzebya rosea]
MIDAKIVSPDRALFEGDVSEVYARSTEGEIGILTGHQPVLLLLASAPLELVGADGTRTTFAVRSGFLQYADGKLTVLADFAEEVADKDAAHAAVEKYTKPGREAHAPAPA